MYLAGLLLTYLYRIVFAELMLFIVQKAQLYMGRDTLYKPEDPIATEMYNSLENLLTPVISPQLSRKDYQLRSRSNNNKQE